MRRLVLAATVLIASLSALAQSDKPSSKISAADSRSPVPQTPSSGASTQLAKPDTAPAQPITASAAKPATEAQRNIALSSATVAADEKSKPVDWFTRTIAIIGLVASVAGFGFTIYKTRRDRRLSIEDDFWFRKIITPTTIEPMLQSFVTLLDQMPTRGCTEETQRSFALKVTSEFQRLNSTAQVLALFHGNLPAEVCAKLTLCEDSLMEYSTKLAHADDGPDSSIATVKHRVWAQLNDVLRVIRDRQLRH